VPRSEASAARKREYGKQWKKDNRARHREHSRCSKLKRFYGITCAEYVERVAAQRGLCAICAGVNPAGHRLSVDHDHATGKVRGLLCHACNAGMGKLRDDPALLRAAADYLEKE
jgi:hypothetical protein